LGAQPLIYVACGDVNGIGLRCLAGAIEQAPELIEQLRLVIDPEVADRAAEVYGIRLPVPIHEIEAPCRIMPGQAETDAALLAMESLTVAAHLAYTQANAGLVTLPVNKHTLRSAGWTFPGQTEMVASVSGGEPLMVLCSGAVRVALATIHIPLRAVAARLTTALIADKLEVFKQHLMADVGLAQPRIAVLGLNPHASEQGEIGTEDIHIVAPAVDRARQQGIDASGPFPADGFFGFGAYKEFDGILAMYHDQGLIPLKLLSQGAGVNVTAGLSIVRTSPDHGTAYHLAQSLHVAHESTLEALRLCSAIIRQRQLKA
jgi:4-hydroxythreonine-4-phosphate dehydrogenase